MSSLPCTSSSCTTTLQLGPALSFLVSHISPLARYSSGTRASSISASRDASMANTDNEGPVVSESFPKEGHASNHISIGPVLTEDSSSIQDVSASKSPANPSPEPPAGEPNSSKESFTAKPTAGPNGDASSALNSSRPTLTQLPSNGTTAAPLPKRFSAVNISKKFLEKNSSPATNSMASSSSSQAKSGGSAGA